MLKLTQIEMKEGVERFVDVGGRCVLRGGFLLEADFSNKHRLQIIADSEQPYCIDDSDDDGEDYLLSEMVMFFNGSKASWKKAYRLLRLNHGLQIKNFEESEALNVSQGALGRLHLLRDVAESMRSLPRTSSMAHSVKLAKEKCKHRARYHVMAGKVTARTTDFQKTTANIEE